MSGLSRARQAFRSAVEAKIRTSAEELATAGGRR